MHEPEPHILLFKSVIYELLPWLVTNRLTGALLTTNPLCNNRLVIDWRRYAWKYEQLRKTSLYVPLSSFMAGTRAFAIFLISVHKSFMIEVLE